MLGDDRTMIVRSMHRGMAYRNVGHLCMFEIFLAYCQVLERWGQVPRFDDFADLVGQAFHEEAEGAQSLMDTDVFGDLGDEPIDDEMLEGLDPEDPADRQLIDEFEGESESASLRRKFVAAVLTGNIRKLDEPSMYNLDNVYRWASLVTMHWLHVGGPEVYVILNPRQGAHLKLIGQDGLPWDKVDLRNVRNRECDLRKVQRTIARENQKLISDGVNRELRVAPLLADATRRMAELGLGPLPMMRKVGLHRYVPDRYLNHL